MGVATTPKYPDLLEDWTWEQIAEVANRGEMQKYHSIGDEKTAASTQGVLTFRIEDFNHDDKADGSGKANVTFGSKNLIFSLYSFNTTASNVGGWSDSVMRVTRIPAFMNWLPADLKNAIKPVMKRTTIGNQSTTIQSTTDSLWLFSCKEVGTQTDIAGYMDEGERYPLYTNDASRVKGLNDGNGGPTSYWLRSPYTIANNQFCICNANGAWTASGPTAGLGVCLGFCI